MAASGVRPERRLPWTAWLYGFGREDLDANANGGALAAWRLAYRANGCRYPEDSPRISGPGPRTWGIHFVPVVRKLRFSLWRDIIGIGIRRFLCSQIWKRQPIVHVL